MNLHTHTHTRTHKNTHTHTYIHTHTHTHSHTHKHTHTLSFWGRHTGNVVVPRTSLNTDVCREGLCGAEGKTSASGASSTHAWTMAHRPLYNMYSHIRVGVERASTPPPAGCVHESENE